MRPTTLTTFVLVAASLALAAAGEARQLRVSPGPLARAHADLEGVANCGKCHEAGESTSAHRCLSCHQPIAKRMAERIGVHRDVTGDCQKCHAEHRGAAVDLRQISPDTFKHDAETSFALENEHAKLAANCTACHKTRSFLTARSACVACHADVHKGNLGNDCKGCHSTAVPFKQTRRHFEHERARFVLTGAHRTAACEKCHPGGLFRGLRFDACSACHKEPHRRPLGPACTTCHVTDQWKTRVIDHARTGFTLVGAHTRVKCEQCHTVKITTPLRGDRCAACHANVHRTSMKDDCRTCHNEAGFRGATFDHAAGARFPFVGKHEGLPCRKCHTGLSAPDVPLALKTVNFSGASSECVSCHKDEHKGEFGRACDACHRPVTFKSKAFVHPRSPEFFGGRHAGVPCAKCHVKLPDPKRAKAGLLVALSRGASPSIACATCHGDVHLGQVGGDCDRCHTVGAANFAPERFSHDRTAFPLTGVHKARACEKCHPSATRAYPAGAGTARQVKPLATECRACHKDPHLGQTDSRCKTCHSTASFRLLAYTHTGMDDFFGGFHGRLPCRSCHVTETGQFPGGRGTAIRLKVGRTCAACHPKF